MEKGLFLPGEKVNALDDHTSGGRNARLFQLALQSYGLEVTHFFNIVDREQGGRQVLETYGLTVRSIFTISDLLRKGVSGNHIKQIVADDVMDYIQNNSIPTLR